MPISAYQEPKVFDKIPTGLYDAELVEITEPKPYPGFPDPKTGKVKEVMKSRWVFEITNASDTELVGEKISSFINMEGAGEKSGLYKMLKNLGLNPDYDYETEELVGRKVQLYVKVETNPKTKKTASNISDISVKKGQPTLGRPHVTEEAGEETNSIPF